MMITQRTILKFSVTLFLAVCLFSCNLKVKNEGNENPEFDRLFLEMRSIPGGTKRDGLVTEMVGMVRRDVVWMSSYHVREYYLNNPWVFNTKRNAMTRGTLQYVRLDTELRKRMQVIRNKAVIWPVLIGLVLFFALLFPAVNAYRRRQKMTISSEPTS